jgi:hypothetical protein
MAITDERIRQILEGRDIDALLGLINDPQVSEDEQSNVILGALSQLEALLYADLPELVVKVCVEAPEKIAEEVRHFFLSYWIKREGYHYRQEVITLLINTLRKADTDQVIAAILTAWVVGYRDDQLEAELVRIAGLNGEPHPDQNAQGYALAVLSDMAYADSGAITQALKSRLERIGHLTKPDCWAAIHAASPDMIPALCAADDPGSVAVHALLELPSRYPDAVFDVWKAFESLDEDTRFLYASTAVKEIDLEDIGNYVVSEVLTAFQNREHRNLLPPANLLLRANLPSHISFFLKIRDSLSPEQINWLKFPAVTSTGKRIRFQTAESLNKEAAWDVILRLGLKVTLEWLPEAMSEEVNFILAELGEIASFLQVKEAVKPLSSAIRDEAFDAGIGVSCLRSIGVIGTNEALRALLDSQVRIKHGNERLIPRDWVQAMVSACMTLRSYEQVWSTIANPKADKEIREACAYVIEDISNFIEAPLPSPHDIVNLLRTEGGGLPGYDQLILSLSRFRDDTEALSFLREVGASNHESTELTRALALTGILNEFPSRIEKMGLKHTDSGWVVTNRLDDTSAFALLFLYRNDPSFESALTQVLADDSRHPAIQVVANIRSTDNLSENILQALWRRALRWNGPNSSDRSVLEAVARIWPNVLMESSTISEVSRWSASARRAYLASLRTALVEHNNASAIALIASQFLTDAESSVRRDAAWLTRDANPAVLRQAVDQLAAREEELDQAVYILDAAFWLEADWNLYEERGRSHREPLVRQLTRRLSQERKDVLLAHKYLPTVLQSRNYLDTWCYGQALLELGNEETVDGLYRGLPSEVYRRAYLIWLAKELEKRLEKRRRDQSEKLDLPPPISYEEFVEVTVELEGERLGPFTGMLQVSQARRPRRWLWSWSIRIENQQDLVQRLSAVAPDTLISIETFDGRRGQMLPVRTESSREPGQTVDRVLLLGQGELKEY